MNCRCVKVSALTLAVLFCNSPVPAGVIRQAPGADVLVFEAEDFDSVEPAIDLLNPMLEGFRVVTTGDPIMDGKFDHLALPPDANVSGGAALYTTNATCCFMASSATWKLEFAIPGLYSLYLRYTLYDTKRADNYDNEDSWFLPLNFNEPADHRFDWSTLGHNDSLEEPPYWEGNFHWQQAPLDYEVRPEDIGIERNFIVASREPGSAVDLMVLSLNPELDPAGDEVFEQDLDELFLAPPTITGLQAGDADMDLDFDQLDLVRVQIAAKYLSGQGATWGEGDWDGAPGGQVGNPPTGNGFFDQLDIISALASGNYLSGPYGAIAATPAVAGDGHVDLIYVPEPSTLLLLTSSVVGLLSARRRCRKTYGTPRGKV